MDKHATELITKVAKISEYWQQFFVYDGIKNHAVTKNISNKKILHNEQRTILQLLKKKHMQQSYYCTNN